jgi:hypothetical protein
MFTDMDLTPAAYLSRESIPMGVVNAVMSGAAQKLVEELMKQKVRLSGVNSTAIAKTPKEDYLAVMDGMIENFKSIGDWTEIPKGFYGAVLLAKQDEKCSLNFLTFLKNLPRQRWLNPIIKDIEGTK